MVTQLFRGGATVAKGTIKVMVPDLLRELGIDPEEVSVKELSYDMRIDKQTVRKYLQEIDDIKGIRFSTLAALIEHFGLENDPGAAGMILKYIRDNGSGT